MSTFDQMIAEITPHVLLKAYGCGIFPMAESANDTALYWIEPERRGIIPLDNIHIPKRLTKTIKQMKFDIRIDHDFHGVIDGCSSPHAGRKSTWINARIRELYHELFKLGYCHTIEAWQDDKLVGGLYGVHLAGVFFGESMFSYKRDASKVALTYLLARLKAGNFQLLDTQFVTDHLRTFGAVEITRDKFQMLLDESLHYKADFFLLPEDAPPLSILHLVNQTSKTGC
ncbi:MAG: leucyl/phenylalanyl-tRNA--protein transferase [Pseudomonadota bacterium]